MLGVARARLETDRGWLESRRQSLTDARARLDKAFAALTQEP
jgi:argininosuccinate lyase